MSRTPVAIQYMPADVPPLSVVIINALQYVAVTSSFLVFPLIIAREAHLSATAADSMLAWAMLAMACGTMLQALPNGPVGSGYLAPCSMTAIFLGPSVEAVRLGGLALMSGMTIFAGVVQMGFSQSLNRLRKYLPPELAGVVVFLVGVSNGVVGLRYLLQPDAAALPGMPHWIVAAVTLGVMVGANVWSKGVLGLSCALFGMVAGYLAAIALGVLPWEKLSQHGSLPLLAAPGTGQLGWSFDVTMMLSLVIVAVANGLKAAALLTASQRIVTADWVRPDVGPIGRGVLSDGLSVAAAGVFSTFAVNVSASSVGLTAATGVASRRVAYATSLLFVLLAFLPSFTHALVLTPGPVIGATLLFTSCSILKSGIEAIAVRLYDTRKTLVVGLSIMAGVAVEAFPATFRQMPAWVHPITVSALVFGTAVGFILNLCFRFGVRQRTAIAVDPRAPDLDALARFVEACGAGWGARRDVVSKAEWAVQELVGVVTHHCSPRGPLNLSAKFDEFNLEVELRYAGELLPIVHDRPTTDEIVDRDDGAQRLAAYLLRRYTTRMSSSSRDGNATVRLQFDH